MAASDYPNGRIPLNEMVHVGNGQYLEPTTAAYWSAMVIAAGQAGVALACLEGYRTYDEQVRLRNLYLYDGGNPAGIPGTSSHGWGKAVDVYNTGGFGSAKYAWLAANGPKYGFTNTQGRADGEAWHWVFGSPTIPAGQLGVSIPGTNTTQEDDDMVHAVECHSPGPDYQKIALFGSAPKSGYQIVYPNERVAYFNPLTEGLVKAGAYKGQASAAPRGVNQAEWNAVIGYFTK